MKQKYPITDKNQKINVWLKGLDLAWKNYESELNRIQNKRENSIKFMSIMVGFIALVVSILIYFTISIIWLISLVIISSLSLIGPLFLLIKSYRLKIPEKRDFIDINKYTEVMNRLNEKWQIIPIVGKSQNRLGFIRTQYFTITTEGIDKERRRKFLIEKGKLINNYTNNTVGLIEKNPLLYLNKELELIVYPDTFYFSVPEGNMNYIYEITDKSGKKIFAISKKMLIGIAQSGILKVNGTIKKINPDEYKEEQIRAQYAFFVTDSKIIKLM